MKPKIPMQFTRGWNVLSVIVELVIICLVLLLGLKPPVIYISASLVLCGLLSGALCNYLFIVHLTQKLCAKMPECKPLCEEANKGKRLGSRALGLFVVIAVIAFIVVWPSCGRQYDDPMNRIITPAGWFLAFLSSESLWFDLAKFRYLWSRKGVLRKLTKSSEPVEKK